MSININDSASSAFAKQVAVLRRIYPSVDRDLAQLYEDISNQHPGVSQSHALPGYDGKVWKYRCDSTDMNRGKSGSFRVLVYFRPSDGVAYPICIYQKKDYEKAKGGQPPNKEIGKWINNLIFTDQDRN